MKRSIVIIAVLTIVAMIVSLPGCEKEKIVESTEYVHEVEYVELPADTVFRIDTVFNQDSITVQDTDTVVVSDTVLISDTLLVSDTVIQTDYIYDTTVVVDTVEVGVDHYDTVFVVDTLQIAQCEPSQAFASEAMQYHCNSVVLEAVSQEIGYSDGWIFYLSIHQAYVAQVSSNVFDLYGYIDYWTPEWDNFLAFEFYWRMTYLGGDPASPSSWDMAEPPAATVTHQPGVRLTPDNVPAQRSLR